MSTKRAIPLAELMGKSKVPRVEPPKAEPPSGDNETLETELQDINAVQNELVHLEEAQAEEVLQVARKYYKMKQPVYEKRQQAIDKVPEFWFRVLLAHPHIGEAISDLDQEPLRHLTSLEVVEVEGTQQDYRINFHFSGNSYFSNKTLWKEFRFREDDATVVSSDVQWKDTQESNELQATLVTRLMALEPVPDDVQPSFFSIFHPEDRDFQLGDLFKSEVWVDPLGIYMSAEFDEQDEEGGEEGSEEEGEEGAFEGGEEGGGGTNAE